MYASGLKRAQPSLSRLWAGGTGDPSGHGQADGANRRRYGGVAQACASPTANPVGARPQGVESCLLTFRRSRGMQPYNRDLSDVELWERSLRRSVHRREITEAARKHAARRKGAAVAVTASMAAGPAAAPFAALARRPAVRRSRRRRRCAAASAIAMPSGALVVYGDTGEAVAAVQRLVGVDDDGIFGPITRGAVERFQARHGLAGDRPGRRHDVDDDVQVERVLRGRRRQDDPDRLPAAVGRAARDAGRLRARRRRCRRRTKKRVDTTPRATTPRRRRTEPADAPPTAARDDPAAPAPAAARRVRRGPASRAGQRARPPASTARRAPATPTPARTSRRRPAPPSAPPSAAPSPRPARTAAATATWSASSTRAACPRATPTSRRSTTTKGAYVHVGDVIGKVGCTGSLHRPAPALRGPREQQARQPGART